MIQQYYNRLKHLKIAQSYVKDITNLLNLLDNYHRREAVNLVSRLTLKYEHGINKIGLYSDARSVEKGNVEDLYKDYSDENLVDDIEYLIECIIIIAVVNLKIEPSIETVIEKLSYV